MPNPGLRYRQPELRWMAIAGVAALCLHGLCWLGAIMLNGHSTAAAEVQRQVMLALFWMIGTLIIWKIAPSPSRLHAVMTVLAIYQLAGAPEELRMKLMLGASYQVCARNIVIISAPIFLGLFWALRSLAPSRLTLAGAIAGVLAGAVGTFIYAFHCNESAMPFVAIWYTLGIAAVGALGALLGRATLRW